MKEVNWTIGITQLPEFNGKCRAFFPTHSFEIIKKHREYLYHTLVLVEFLNERKIKALNTTSNDTELLRCNWLNDELKEIDRISNIPGISRNDLIELEKYKDYVNTELNPKNEITIKKASEKKQLLSIPTKASKEEILNFWFELLTNNKKGEPYWVKQEIEHFVNQNFEGFPGVSEFKVFNPEMDKRELLLITYKFFQQYGKHGTKRQYVDLLKKNFTKFRNDSFKNIYGNIKFS